MPHSRTSVLQQARAGVGAGATTVRVLGRAGVIRPHSPVSLAKAGKALRDWGVGPAGGFHAAALLARDRVAIIDERGRLTFGELHRRANALARGLAARGVGAGDAVAVMCRNHRGFVEATIAVGRLGADAIFLNTAFAGPQLTDVLARERPRVVIYDEEFAGLLDEAEVPERVLAWTEDPDAELAGGTPTLESLIADQPGHDLVPAQWHGRIIILTSGTTGTPKGAPRTEAGIDAAVSLLSRMPLERGWRTHIAAPLFHTWGFAHLALAMLLNSTMVLRRRFDPADFLDVLESERCDSAVVIPVMLQRVLALPSEQHAPRDLSALRVVASSGSALPGDLALEWMDRFGDNLYNIYGSTEVAYASIATPQDLRADPTAAGRPPYATVVRILDGDGRPVPAGEPGRIFVGNRLLFEGYTDGGGKEVVDGLMATGDVGRLDADGLLRVEGRDDDMVVSGGENVFPQEVEDCLMRHPDVVEAAAIGVPDPDFGQGLRAFVALRPGATATAEDLRAHVKKRLARFKVPREVIFLPALPRNATGKVLKRDLAR